MLLSSLAHGGGLAVFDSAPSGQACPFPCTYDTTRHSIIRVLCAVLCCICMCLVTSVPSPCVNADAIGTCSCPIFCPSQLAIVPVLSL